MMHYFAHNDVFPRPEGKDYQLAGNESIEIDWHSNRVQKEYVSGRVLQDAE